MGTPVYTDNMSAQMKTVMDRCICGMDPFLRLDPCKPGETPLQLDHAFKILSRINIGISGDGRVSSP